MRKSKVPATDRPIQVSSLAANETRKLLAHWPRLHSIIVMHRGSAELEVANSTLQLKEGCLLLIGSQDWNRIQRWHPQSAQISILGFCRDQVVEGASTVESIEYLRLFEGQNNSTPSLVDPSTGSIEEITGLMHRIRTESDSPGPHSALVMKTYLKLVLILIRQQNWDAKLSQTVHSEELARIQPLLQYLGQHYMETISVDQAAQLLNMSNSHFMRLFKHTTGSAFVPYLNRLRISRAQQLLGECRLSISEVSESVGFRDHSYFSCVFRQVSGIRPREYRKTLI